MKRVLLILFISVLSAPSFALDVKPIVEEVLGVGNIEKAIKYRTNTADRVINGEDANKVDGSTEGIQNAIIYSNQATDAIPGLDEYKARFPIYAYQGVHDIDNKIPMFVKRCEDPNPLECYKLQQNVNVNAAQGEVDKIPRTTPCSADDPCE